MIISLAAKNFDPDGVAQLNVPVSGLQVSPQERRSSKYKTLDGGVAIVDFGYYDADSNIEITLEDWTQEQERIIYHLVRNYPLIYASMPAGFYDVVPLSVEVFSGRLRLKLSVKEKIQ